ncbi:MAG: type II toxin-antitoxin system HicB family antitoxin [Chloroflexota bacterium]|nr:type II toxin-antitoxin system HicB family antitoxin [Chloroflexota bacterium]
MAAKKAVDEILSRPYEIDFEYGADAEDGVLAYVVEWPDCFAAGRDRTEALTALERAMRELAAYRLDHGLEVPQAASGFSGKVLLRMPKKLHRDAERNATRDGVSLNTWLTTAIAREVGPTKGSTRARSTRIAEKKARYRAG